MIDPYLKVNYSSKWMRNPGWRKSLSTSVIGTQYIFLKMLPKCKIFSELNLYSISCLISLVLNFFLFVKKSQKQMLPVTFLHMARDLGTKFGWPFGGVEHGKEDHWVVPFSSRFARCSLFHQVPALKLAQWWKGKTICPASYRQCRVWAGDALGRGSPAQPLLRPRKR